MDSIWASLSESLTNGQWREYFGQPAEQLALAIASELEVAHVRLVPSGTAAVELALRACRLQATDEVILAAFDYPGNFRSVTAVGGLPVMVDVAAGSWSIDLKEIEKAITPKSRVIIASHLYQEMVDAAALRQLADDAGLVLLEDACQAPGASVRGRPAGSWGHVGTLSFGGSKVLTSGNGGAILTSDPRIEQRLKILLERPGDTYPLSQLQAAALLPQWQSLNTWNQHRRAAANALSQAVADCHGCQLPAAETFAASPALYKWAWLAPNETTRDQQVRTALELGLPSGTTFPVFSKRSQRIARRIGNCPNAEIAARCGVVLDHRALAIPAEQRGDLIARLRYLFAACGE